ncbi:nitronate monooxygenase [Planococcus maritimus]|uniref:Probable nitronate monooxygenase n=1 Tax=Planococcus maritimus TaxID=192421 RepID=A0A7D7SGA5_PLAMR|nr:nitronate monooxygenase [Planococcus maritimus]KYG59729.1 2-nitropropane dioxygenase [Planococcus maritimus]OED33431.1 2-nitropropane dioxygenase [Planococcus maritimus]QMT17065.1 nitronate monooxygenase [Planococcus maritimus]
MPRLPVIVAPMFLVSTPQMVIESSRAGAIGSFPLLNARPAEECAKWLVEVKNALGDIPWAVNFISHRGSNKRYDEDVELIREHQPPIVITSLGSPAEVLEIVHGYGGLVYSDVANAKHAKKAAQSGVDGLILVCAGAGGHGGTLNPFAFIAAVKKFFDGTIILSGSLSTGQDVAAALLMGADYAYMGTRFLAVEESSAPEEYKQMVIDSSIEDILYTDSFSGVPVNVLVPSLEKQGIDPKTLKPKKEVDLSHLVNAKAWRDIWSAGHGVTTVTKRETVKQVVEQLEQEYAEGVGALVRNH